MPPYLRLLSLSLIAWSMGSHGLWAQLLSPSEGGYRLEHLSPRQGLSDLRVYSILEDGQGVIWISTKAGVDRYNGAVVQRYELTEGQRYADAGGRIIQLSLGGDGRLYAYDNKGKLYGYDAALDSFKLLQNLHDELDGAFITTALSVDRLGGTVWGLDRGVYRRALQGTSGGSWLLEGQHVHALVATPQGYLVGTSSGLYRLGAAVRSEQLVAGRAVYSLYADAPHGRLWIGTLRDKLLCYDLERRKLLEPPAFGALPPGPVRALTPLGPDDLLVGIDGHGVYRVHRVRFEVSPFLTASERGGARLSSNGIYAVVVDQAENIWVGSYSGGVDVAIAREPGLELMRHEPMNSQSLLDNSVNALLELQDGRLVLATERGVSLYAPREALWKHLLEGQVALALAEPEPGVLLVGTYGGGVYEFRGRGDRAVQRYSVANGQLRSDYVYSLHRTADGWLWIGCLDGDLVAIKGGERRYYPVQQVQSITSAPGGGVAVATSNGFALLTPGSEAVQWHFTSEALSGGDYNAYINHLCFLSPSEVLLATDGGGIYRYDLRRREVTSHYTAQDGLPSNSVYALAPVGGGGRILATTSRGALILSVQEGGLTPLSHLRGIDEEFRRAAVAALTAGRIALGGNGGAVVLTPSNLKLRGYDARLRLRSLKLLPEWHVPGDTLLPRRLMAALESRHLSLPYRQNTFTLTYESILLNYQQDIVYQHRLLGLDKDWSPPTDQQWVSYSHLPDGHYTLEVRAVSEHSGRVLDTQRLEVDIHPPLWRSWWAYVLYALALGGSLYVAWRVYHTRLERRAFGEKIKFFVHTAHDIRTPLSLVLAPLGELEHEETLSDKGRHYLGIARHNGQKLLSMVTQLLDFQRLDRDEVEMRVQELELVAFVEERIASYQVLAEQQEVALSFGHTAAPVLLWLDATMASSILDNLLSNALKYTAPGGQVAVSLSILDGDWVELEVTDTGIGIPREAQSRIFQSFYRSNNAINAQVVGSGIGLMLTRRLVERHGGKLSMRSIEGEGSTFTIRLRRGNAHLRPYLVSAREEGQGVKSEASPPSRPLTVAQSERPDDEVDTLLFVDDNAELRRYVRLSMGDHYHVVDVPSAEEALLYLETGLADIIISDVMMPGMSGVEFCRALKSREETAWIPIILLTARSGRDFALEGLSVGAEGYIEKPFDPTLLKARVETILTNRRHLGRYYLERVMRSGDESPSETTPGADPGAATSALDPESQLFVERATEHVLRHLHREDFSIDELCRLMAMSRTLFYARLKSVTGQAPQDFIRFIRLSRAATLLLEGHPVLDVSVMTGFTNVKYFSTLFKKHYGVSPSKYRPS